ncbi:MAG: hypothetical protein NVS1B13_08510 [Flavisolibacter sp.]
MKESLKDILSHLHPDIDQQTLLNYLQGKLASEKQHELEKGMMDNDFNIDALEGLQEFRDKKNIEALIELLNKDLKAKTEKKKNLKKRISLKLDPWTLVTLVVLLALLVIGFVVIYKKIHGSS